MIAIVRYRDLKPVKINVSDAITLSARLFDSGCRAFHQSAQSCEAVRVKLVDRNYGILGLELNVEITVSCPQP